MLLAACEQFLGKTEDEIQQVALETLEGHQRAIMGSMTVEVGQDMRMSWHTYYTCDNILIFFMVFFISHKNRRKICHPFQILSLDGEIQFMIKSNSSFVKMFHMIYLKLSKVLFHIFALFIEDMIWEIVRYMSLLKQNSCPFYCDDIIVYSVLYVSLKHLCGNRYIMSFLCF